MILFMLEVAGIGFQNDWEERYQAVFWEKMKESGMTVNLSKICSWSFGDSYSAAILQDHQWPKSTIMGATLFRSSLKRFSLDLQFSI